LNITRLVCDNVVIQDSDEPRAVEKQKVIQHGSMLHKNFTTPEKNIVPLVKLASMTGNTPNNLEKNSGTLPTDSPVSTKKSTPKKPESVAQFCSPAVDNLKRSSRKRPYFEFSRKCSDADVSVLY